METLQVTDLHYTYPATEGEAVTDKIQLDLGLIRPLTDDDRAPVRRIDRLGHDGLLLPAAAGRQDGLAGDAALRVVLPAALLLGHIRLVDILGAGPQGQNDFHLPCPLDLREQLAQLGLQRGSILGHLLPASVLCGGCLRLCRLAAAGQEQQHDAQQQDQQRVFVLSKPCKRACAFLLYSSHVTCPPVSARSSCSHWASACCCAGVTAPQIVTAPGRR